MGNINLNFTEDGKAICPKCGKLMTRMGKGLSGTKWYRQYKCSRVEGCAYKCVNYSEPILPETSEIPTKSN